MRRTRRAPGDEPQPLSLRDAEVAPPRKTLAEILEGLPAAARRLHHEGRARQGDLHRQGGGAAQPRAPVLPARIRRHPRLRAAARGDRRRHRDGRHLEREGGAAPREQPDQAAPAALQRQAGRRQELPGAAPRSRRRSGRASRWCGGSATTARSTSAPTTRRPRAARRCASSTATSSCAPAPTTCCTTARRPCLQYQIKRCPAPCVLPVAREAVRRAGARRAPVPRGQERRAAGAAGGAHEGGGGAHRVRGRRRGARSDPRARDDAGGAAGGVGGLRRPGRVRLHREGDRAGDRRAVDPRRQAARAAARSRSPGRSSPTPSCSRRSSASTTTSARRCPTRCCCRSRSRTRR